MMQRPMSGGGPTRRQKTHPKGRVCESDGCTTILSIYNDDTVCAPCWESIPLEDLDTVMLQRLV